MLPLDKQIGQVDAGDITQLKRTGNSLVNFSARIPPEILGDIFYFNVAPDGDYGGLQSGSYNFLLVCRHWFEVAQGTPKLWIFWGKNPNEWSKRYQRSKLTAGPLDLVFTPRPKLDETDKFSGPLKTALKERMASNSIRSVHLQSWSGQGVIGSVLSSLIPDGEAIFRRDSSIESIKIESNAFLDALGFLRSYYFPKLQRLHLRGPMIDGSVWNHLGLHTPSLTSLSLLCLDPKTVLPTTPQLLSVLAITPQLRSLALDSYSIPNDNGTGYESRVSLPHLKSLNLQANFRSVLQLLDRLDHPKMMDEMQFGLQDCEDMDNLSGAIGPYMLDFLRHDRFKNQLGILANISSTCVSIGAGAHLNCSTLSPMGTRPFQLDIYADRIWDRLFINLASHIPREDVVFFEGENAFDPIQKVVVTMPNIQELRLHRLKYESVTDGDWRPLISYLHRRTSSGQGVSLLRITETTICPSAMEEMKSLVKKFDWEGT